MNARFQNALLNSSGIVSISKCIALSELSMQYSLARFNGFARLSRAKELPTSLSSTVTDKLLPDLAQESWWYEARIRSLDTKSRMPSFDLSPTFAELVVTDSI
jgi:hypothetical protein